MNATYKPRWALALPAPFRALQREMDQMLDEFAGRNGGAAAGAWWAPVNLWEENEHFLVQVELPGVKQEDVNVTLEKNTLRIAAERKPPEREFKYWHQERSYGQVERVINLPETVDPDSIEAELREGVLTVRLSKRPELQPKRISIKTA